MTTSSNRRFCALHKTLERVGRFNLKTSRSKPAALAYAIALLIGIANTAYLLPISTIASTGGLWLHPFADLAQNLTGHLAYQAPGWIWPLLNAPALAWPNGVSIAMTDGNPLVSVIAKLLALSTGHPINLFGPWLAACWVLQPLAAVYAIRGLSRHPLPIEATTAAAVLASCFPAMLARYYHINMLGHFTLLLSLGLTLRLLAAPTPRRWAAASGLLTLSILLHPYLFVFAAAVLAAPVFQAALTQPRQALRTLPTYLLCTAIPIILFRLFAGTLGGGDRGYGFYSMNLLSPIWPQHSGLFGPNLPILDATGGQYEGFNYLGAGGILLILAALAAQLRAPRTPWRPRAGLIAALAILTLIALTPRIYAGQTLLLPLGVKPFDQILASVRSSGRAFWIVGYTILLASLASLAIRLPRPWLAPILALCVTLQWLDTAPIRAEARSYYAGNAGQPLAITLPPAAILVDVFPLCQRSGPISMLGDQLRLAAIQAGMHLTDMRASRQPAAFNCESNLSDGLERPLAPNELRIVLPLPEGAQLRPEALGPNTTCRTQEDDHIPVTLCARGLTLTGTPPPKTPPLPTIPTPATLDGTALHPILAIGWTPDSTGQPWSEGPRATLLFRPETAPGQTITLQLNLEAIARNPGSTRPIQIQLNAEPRQTIDLPDQRPTTIPLTIPPAAMPNGIIRIAIDINRPIDPATRSLQAPVHRAGIRLLSIKTLPSP